MGTQAMEEPASGRAVALFVVAGGKISEWQRRNGRARDETNRARTCGALAGGSERGFVAARFRRGESRGRGSGGFDLRGRRKAFGASASVGGRVRVGARRDETGR